LADFVALLSNRSNGPFAYLLEDPSEFAPTAMPFDAESNPEHETHNNEYDKNIESSSSARRWRREKKCSKKRYRYRQTELRDLEVES
jgi:hypothetical protein